MKIIKILFAVCMLPLAVMANPTGGEIISGDVEIRTSTDSVTINQASDKAIINWDEFSIGFGETTDFIQPSVNSVALNRVVGDNVSEIYGALNSNGVVCLINQNGVLVSPEGVINVAGFTASTLNIGDDAFNPAEDMVLTGDSEATIINKGSITALEGNVVMVAREVFNEGTISAKKGEVGLAGFDKEFLLLHKGSNKIAVKHAEAQGMVSNTGIIESVQAKLLAAGGNIYSLAINQEGIINATGINIVSTVSDEYDEIGMEESTSGRIILTANEGQVYVNGEMKAEGGAVLLTADEVNLEEGMIDVSAVNGDAGYVVVNGAVDAELDDLYEVIGELEGGAGIFDVLDPFVTARKINVGENFTIKADSVSVDRDKYSFYNDAGVIIIAAKDVSVDGDISAKAFGEECDESGGVVVIGMDKIRVNGDIDTYSENSYYDDEYGGVILAGRNLKVAPDCVSESKVQELLAKNEVVLIAEDMELKGANISWDAATSLLLAGDKKVYIHDSEIKNETTGEVGLLALKGGVEVSNSQIEASDVFIDGSNTQKEPKEGLDKYINNGTVTTNGGNGVFIANSTIAAKEDLSLEGEGSDFGVLLFDNTNLSMEDGDIEIVSKGQDGISIWGKDINITSVKGDITITGEASDGLAVDIDEGPAIKALNGNITIDGTCKKDSKKPSLAISIDENVTISAPNGIVTIKGEGSGDNLGYLIGEDNVTIEGKEVVYEGDKLEQDAVMKAYNLDPSFFEFEDEE
jgi:filamentous hemagglutinin family protein